MFIFDEMLKVIIAHSCSFVVVVTTSQHHLNLQLPALVPFAIVRLGGCQSDGSTLVRFATTF